jgi:hydroxymethylpyrimidine/phosphomethylpyrimidine kinase
MRRTNTRHVVRALTIAGSDSGGGAGIQADLKTFAAFEVYGMSVLTAVTAQNTLGVQAVQYLDEAVVRQQIRSVLEDLGADAIKLGMLGSASIMEVVADELEHVAAIPVVLDPVMVAKGGEKLMDDDAVVTLRTRLLPRAALVTPNLPEAEVLYGHRIDSWTACHEAAAAIQAEGARAVVIKGGHASSEWWADSAWPSLASAGCAVDVVYDGSQYTYFATPRVASQKTHGTGCTFSSAVAAALAMGRELLDAIAIAKSFIYDAIRSAVDWDVGHGHGPTDHSVRPRLARGLEAGAAYLWQDGAWVRLNPQ